MIGSFASEGGRPAIFLPEQVEVLAHGVSWGDFVFPFPSDPCSAKASRKGDYFTLWIVAEVSVGRK
jgi:hypothetical protein